MFNRAMEDYYTKVDNGGAILFAVCRGKVSEGIDFADRYGRAVIVTGLPYPNVKDARVKLKRKYLDDRSARARANPQPGVDTITGSDWYNQSAHRAVNQALGRVIRHRFDYGAIILADSRFERSQRHLSFWLRARCTSFDRFGSALGALVKFFRTVVVKDAERQKLLHEAKAATGLQLL